MPACVCACACDVRAFTSVQVVTLLQYVSSFSKLLQSCVTACRELIGQLDFLRGLLAALAAVLLLDTRGLGTERGVGAGARCGPLPRGNANEMERPRAGDSVLNHTVITAEGVASICHGDRVMIIILNGATGQIIRSGETVAEMYLLHLFCQTEEMKRGFWGLGLLVLKCNGPKGELQHANIHQRSSTLL